MPGQITVVIVAILVGVGAIYYTRQQPAPTPAPIIASEAPGEVREFVMESYYSPEQKRPFFSMGEIVVNKGDTVRIKVTNTFGVHDFAIDEYDIKRETPQDQETVIEFTADQVGEFVYYCSKMNHRAMGQWGTLKVLDQ